MPVKNSQIFDLKYAGPQRNTKKQVDVVQKWCHKFKTIREKYWLTFRKKNTATITAKTWHNYNNINGNGKYTMKNDWWTKKTQWWIKLISQEMSGKKII